MASEEPIAAGSAGSAPRASGPAAAAGRQFREEVFPDELDYVRDRRASHGLAAAGELGPHAGVANDLTGVALSGGGIRSATFNLGLLQALARHGLFRHVDYLSTVSGGGFIGSSLSALMSEDARKAKASAAAAARPGAADDGSAGPGVAPEGVAGPAVFPFSAEVGADEAETVKFLRGHSDYLAPQGLTDYLRAFALLARGIALNLVLLVPALMIVSLLGAYAFMGDLMQAARQAGGGEPVEQPLVEPREGVGGPSGWGASDPRPPTATSGRRWLFRGSSEPVGLPALSYEAGEGLRAWGLFGSAPAAADFSIDLWTGSSAITAAAVSPPPAPREAAVPPGRRAAMGRVAVTENSIPVQLTIAAAGHDGSLWLFFPDQLVGGLRPESRRVIAKGEPPLRRLDFSSDSFFLTGQPANGGKPRVWRMVPCGSVSECASCSSLVPTGFGICRPSFGLAKTRPSSPAAVDVERARVGEALAQMPGGRRAAWDRHEFHLPITGASLLLLLAVFVGLYPFAALLAGPLGRTVNGLTGAFRQGATALRGVLRRGDRLAAKKAASTKHRGMALSRRVVGSALLAVPLFALAATQFDTPVEGFTGWHRLLWPVVGVTLMALWWLLSVLFLAPVLRGWRSPWATDSGARRRGTGRLGGALVLLLPALVLLALPALIGRPTLLIPVPEESVWHTVPLWLLMLGWWVGCLGLLMPVLWPGKTTVGDTPERRREWRRRLAARVYAATNLVLWIFLLHSAFHVLARDLFASLVEAVLNGFGVGEAVSASSLTALTLCGFYAGVQFLLWKAFGWLARGGGADAPAHAARSAAAGVGSPAPVVPAPAASTTSIVWRERYEKAFSYALLALAAIALFEVQPYVVYHFHELRERHSLEWLYYTAAIWFLVIVLAAMFLQTLRGVGKTLALICLGILGPLLPFLVYLTSVHALVYGDSWFDLRWALFGETSALISGARLAFYLVTGVVGAYLIGKLVDANATGMHGFYRDRLSQGYLVGVDRDGVLGPEDELSLQEICQEGSGAPYHLLNASLNMQRESAGSQRWRNSDFFIFSKRWCGGPYSEYCRTEHLEHLAPDVHLGSAMAVSGAAAAPNMGSQTSGFLVMLMTLLNVRLGLWLPTPRRVRRLARLGMIGAAADALGRLRRWWLRLRNRPSGYHLVDEMTSRLDASGPYVNLSDGGHLENTGAYELLRRRCRFVIIGEAESDPEMRFEALARLMRFASIDLGIRIDIDPEPLRPGPDGMSRGHWAVGVIRYPPVVAGGEWETGRLLYVKASVDGRESEIIREYRARHRDFPQESTADQVFEEDQFEAYRALGFHIGGELFAALPGDAFATPADIETWLEGLSRPAAAAEPS